MACNTASLNGYREAHADMIKSLKHTKVKGE